MDNRAAGTATGETIYINGRFLGRPVTGVERFAGMLLKEIDAMMAAGNGRRWEIVAPADVAKPDFLTNLRFSNVGRLRGHAWEQFDLWRATRGGVLVNLCNSGPVLHGRQLTVLHDALVYRHPEYFSRPYRLLHRTLGRLLARRSELATVSAFSRSEISEILHVPAAKIEVIANAVDHMAGIIPDHTVIDRFKLTARKFFLFVGSPAPNKNLLRTIKAFTSLGRSDLALVIVGSAAKSFAASSFDTLPSNVIATGRLSDAEIEALYQSAAALVFPSLYEGFGIPPLEAMRAGCLVLASDIPPVREVCGDAALYFSPLSVESIAQAMADMADQRINLSALAALSKQRAESSSWRDSAQRLVARTEEIAQRRISTTPLMTKG